MRNLNTFIKNKRKSIKMTQFELSNRAGASQAAISKIEAGKNLPGLLLGVKIFKVLGEDLKTLNKFI